MTVNWENMITLLERSIAGFKVEVGVVPGTDEVMLVAQTDSYHAKVQIPPEQALEAFRHPCAFIPDADRFFRALREGEASETVQKGSAVAVMDVRLGEEFCQGCGHSLYEDENGYCNRCSAS